LIRSVEVRLQRLPTAMVAKSYFEIIGIHHPDDEWPSFSRGEPLYLARHADMDRLWKSIVGGATA